MNAAGREAPLAANQRWLYCTVCGMEPGGDVHNDGAQEWNGGWIGGDALTAERTDLDCK